MVENNQVSTTTPLFSIVVGVYNDWTPLEQCLRSLAQQANPPSFEVIVVDDGSKEVVPESIGQWIRYYPLTIVSQAHLGISAARNRGVQIARGAVLVFADADCEFEGNCLSSLASAVGNSTRHDYFQLHLRGDDSGPVGRAEELRLVTFQNHMLQPDGCIRYLNTAGFAIRRTKVNTAKGLFNPVARRAEDTLLLADLLKRGELPFFVSDASVQHVISLSFLECLRKDIHSAYLERTAYNIINSKGIRVRMSHRERLRMLLSAWKTSGQSSIGRLAWFVLVARQMLQRMVSFTYWCFRVRPRLVRPGSRAANSS